MSISKNTTITRGLHEEPVFFIQDGKHAWIGERVHISFNNNTCHAFIVRQTYYYKDVKNKINQLNMQYHALYR